MRSLANHGAGPGVQEGESGFAFLARGQVTEPPSASVSRSVKREEQCPSQLVLVSMKDDSDGCKVLM